MACKRQFIFYVAFLLLRSFLFLVAWHIVSQSTWSHLNMLAMNLGKCVKIMAAVSRGQGQFQFCQVSLLVVDAGDGGTEVVGAEGLDGHLLDDMLELRGGHLDLVDLAGQHLGVVLVYGGL